MISTSPLVGVVKPVIIETALLFPAAAAVISEGVCMTGLLKGIDPGHGDLLCRLKKWIAWELTSTVVTKESGDARVHCEVQILHRHF